MSNKNRILLNEIDFFFGTHYNISKYLSRFTSWWNNIEFNDKDTIYITPKRGKRDELNLLGHALGADEVDWVIRDNKEVLRVWWD